MKPIDAHADTDGEVADKLQSFLDVLRENDPVGWPRSLKPSIERAIHVLRNPRFSKFICECQKSPTREHNGRGGDNAGQSAYQRTTPTTQPPHQDRGEDKPYQCDYCGERYGDTACCDRRYEYLREHGDPIKPPADAEALAKFTEYFVRNYPGPDTIISNPKWHAPRIFRAAKHALAALTEAKQQGPGEVLARGWFHALPDDDYEFHDDASGAGKGCAGCIRAVIVRETPQVEAKRQTGDDA